MTDVQGVRTRSTQHSPVDTGPLGDLLADRVNARPDAPFLVVDDEIHTFGEILTRSRATAARLAGLGVRPGDRVGVLMPNSADAVETIFACGMIGVCAVVLNTRFAPPEIAHVVADADLHVLVISGLSNDRVDFEGQFAASFPDLVVTGDRVAVREAPGLRQVLVAGDASTIGLPLLASLPIGDGPPATEVALRDVAMMIYTSGTTSMPKGSPLSHEALIGGGVSIGRHRFHLGPRDRLWDPLPVFHLSFVLPLLACLDAGATFVTQRHFAAGPALAQIRRERVTAAWPAFPAITEALLDHPDHTTDSLASIRVMLNVAPPQAMRTLQARTPHTVQVSAYGCSEAGGVSAVNTPDEDLDRRADTQGKPFPGTEIAARDPFTDEFLGPDEIGELAIRSWSVFGGYWRDPQRTADCFTEDGWFRTGDRGSVAADGTVSYRGRYKDMIKVGGENVAALEIESVLVAHPGVAVAAVVGVPDARYVEVPAAAVELRPGSTATPDELLDFCRTRLARFKVPSYLVLRSEWPMSATKIQKFRLREDLCADLGLDAG